ncbi:hypothetical protein IE53DRAFT_385796 [Violaceomyces palustris]|uniref:Uncharacterized protein n=1 Tax=Violaceomyces palustris TaxID=1673888 RepID=A0ACD0P1E0_9BASI|nr:hypothetical protein IE53DRAFT_385796 [Violaceomyces palustris]
MWLAILSLSVASLSLFLLWQSIHVKPPPPPPQRHLSIANFDRDLGEERKQGLLK